MFHSHVEIAREYVDFCWPFLKEQHKQMCYIFCFSYPLDLRKKSWTQSPVEIDVLKNKQTYKSSDISRTITRFSSSTSSPNLPTFPCGTSFSAKISMLSWCNPHTHTHTLIHTQKKDLQPCRIGVSVLQLGRFFFQKIFRLLKPDQSSAPFLARVKKLHPNLILT